jgi:antitoxin VapB
MQRRFELMVIAKVFKNGRSQAIRLPKEFRVDADEVYLKRTPDGFLVIARDPWELFFEGVAELSSNFMEDRVQPEVEEREWPV